MDLLLFIMYNIFGDLYMVYTSIENPIIKDIKKLNIKK
jgi:hypothetical protein